MSRKRKVNPTEDENPEWTRKDFARAKPLREILPRAALASFKKYRGPQKEPKKVPVSIRLSPLVVAHFKAAGPGWQRRINDALLRLAKQKSARKKSKAA